MMRVDTLTPAQLSEIVAEHYAKSGEVLTGLDAQIDATQKPRVVSFRVQVATGHEAAEALARILAREQRTREIAAARAAAPLALPGKPAR